MAHIVGLGQNKVGIAAVDAIAGVLLGFTQRLPAAQTVLAVAAGAVEPGHTDTIPFLDVFDACTDRVDKAHTFMARDKGGLRLDGPVAFHGVKIGMADPGGLYPHQYLTRAGLRNRNFANL